MANKKIPPEKMKKKITLYFDIYLKKGYSIKGLSHFLMEEGYPPDIIDEVAAEHTEKIKLRKEMMVFASLIIAIGIVSVLVYLFTVPLPPEITEGIADCGFNKECLFEFANDCRDAVYHQDEDGTIIRYEISECNLIISFEKFAPDEPDTIIALLADKSMACTYEKNDFSLDWTESFISGIEFCEGELKNALFSLRVAQLALAP